MCIRDRDTGLSYTLVAVSLIVSLLTLLVMVRAWVRAFWRRLEDVEHPPAQLVSAYQRAKTAGKRPKPLSPGLVLPTAGLVALGLAFTVLAGPLYDLSDRAAADMMSRTPYISAVLGDEAAQDAARDLAADPTEASDDRD
mgnify:FL=1